jgi:hypothetical protein
MPRKMTPINDDELAGLIMAVTAEAGHAGWKVFYSLRNDGGLLLVMYHPEKRFGLITADNGSSRLMIEPVTAEKELIDA